MIHERLRELRKQKGMTQADISERTGLLRVYLSRLENGRTTPSVKTLENLARAFDIPMYRFFYDGDEPPKPPSVDLGALRVSCGAEADFEALRRTLAKLSAHDRAALLTMASGFVRGSRKKPPR